MIVFSDVDGTLLNSQHQVLDSTLHAISQLKQKKIPFVIVSGRREKSVIKPILDVYHFKVPMILCNGALITDENGNRIWSQSFSLAQAKDILFCVVEMASFDVTYSVYTTNHWMVKDDLDPRIVWEENLVNCKSEKMTLDEVDPREEVYKLIFAGKEEEVSRLEKYLKECYPEYSIAKSASYQLEVMNVGVNKGSGIRKFLSFHQAPLEETIAFGDNYNDVEMLSTVKTPVLMGNAPDELKARFTTVTDDCDHDGIYHYLKNTKVI